MENGGYRSFLHMEDRRMRKMFGVRNINWCWLNMMIFSTFSSFLYFRSVKKVYIRMMSDSEWVMSSSSPFFAQSWKGTPLRSTMAWAMARCSASARPASTSPRPSPTRPLPRRTTCSLHRHGDEEWWVMNKGCKKEQVRQCLGFCTADL